MFVDTTQGSNEVILESSHCEFNGVDALNAQRGQLKVNVFLPHELFQYYGACVFQGTVLSAISRHGTVFCGGFDTQLGLLCQFLFKQVQHGCCCRQNHRG